MATSILVKQKGFFKKKITLDQIKKILGNKYAFGTKDTNISYVLKDLPNDDLSDRDITVYDPKHIGRGFIIHPNDKDMELYLNYPCTSHDVRIFFDVVKSICESLKANTFILDNEKEHHIDDINNLCNGLINFNIETLRSQFTNLVNANSSFICFAAEHPIEITDTTIREWLTLPDKELEEVYDNFLHTHQSRDLYYMAPTIYKDEQNNAMAAYTLTKTVDSIVPKQAFIPRYFQLNNPDFQVNEWRLGLFDIESNEIRGYISYQKFEEILNTMRLEEYDDSHWVLTGVDEDFFKKLLD